MLEICVVQKVPCERRGAGAGHARGAMDSACTVLLEVIELILHGCDFGCDPDAGCDFGCEDLTADSAWM